MASLYSTLMTGDGLTTDTAYRASGFDGVPHAVLMAQIRRPGVIVYSPRDDVDIPDQKDVVLLHTEPTHADLVTWARGTVPTVAERNALDAWAVSGALDKLPAGSEAWTWWDCIHYFAHQVNPGADLASLSALG